MNFTDILGRPLVVGQIIAYGGMQGQSCILRLGKITKISEKFYGTTQSHPRIQVHTIGQDYDFIHQQKTPWNLADKKLTLTKLGHILIIDETSLPSDIRGLFDAVKI